MAEQGGEKNNRRAISFIVATVEWEELVGIVRRRYNGTRARGNMNAW
jgi:hypothetical protein